MKNKKKPYNYKMSYHTSVTSRGKPIEKKCQIADDDWNKIVKLNPHLGKKQIVDRCSTLLTQWENASCLNSWTINKLYGVGTVGTVMGGCSKIKGQKIQCAAIKIQKIQTKEEEKSLNDEIDNQKEAGPEIAPEIYETCMFEVHTSKGLEKNGAIIMEVMDGEADAWLQFKRSKRELDDFANQVRKLVENLHKLKMTHGDLIYFNIAYKKINSTTKKFFLIDFDRATQRFSNMIVDLSRLILELYPRPIASKKQKELNRENAEYLLKIFLKWAEEIKLPHYEDLGNKKKVEEYWVKAYNKYCKDANVKCLE